MNRVHPEVIFDDVIAGFCSTVWNFWHTLSRTQPLTCFTPPVFGWCDGQNLTPNQSPALGRRKIIWPRYEVASTWSFTHCQLGSVPRHKLRPREQAEGIQRTNKFDNIPRLQLIQVYLNIFQSVITAVEHLQAPWQQSLCVCVAYRQISSVQMSLHLFTDGSTNPPYMMLVQHHVQSVSSKTAKIHCTNTGM